MNIEKILLFLLTLAGGVILTKLLIKQLPIFGMIDQPSHRRIHKIPTPRGGGLAIVFAITVFGSGYEYFIAEQISGFFKILLSFFSIAIISFLDDIKTVPVIVRFIIHLICSSVAVFLFLYPATLLHHELPVFFDFIISVIALTAFLNIYNFLDGVDGITAIESIHLTVTILLICYLKNEIIINVYFIEIIAIILLASSISFLFFNWYPAQIFLGDVGSISLGFLIGLCLLLISASSAHLFVSATIASLYYLADGGLTILIRMINREKIWKPHLKHFFQQALRNGKTEKEVVYHVILCNSLLMLFSIAALYYPVLSVIGAIIVVVATLTNFARTQAITVSDEIDK